MLKQKDGFQGESPIAYFNRLKVEYACKLLKGRLQISVFAGDVPPKNDTFNTISQTAKAESSFLDRCLCRH